MQAAGKMMDRKSRWTRFAYRLLASVVIATAATAPAQATTSWPTKPVTIVVPFAPGGGTDLGARLVAQKLCTRWGQSVVVENKTGAGGVVGVDAVARARPDGYTLLVGNVGTQSINPTLYKKLPYDPDKALAPVGLIADLPFFVLAYPGLPANNVTELIALARKSPGKIGYASSGNGGMPHLSGEIFQAMSGTQLLHVPYKGGGVAMTDLIAGHVQLLFASVLESIGHVKAGKLKALAVTAGKRLGAFPDVPTFTELGVDYDISIWYGLMAPAGTPTAIVERLAAATQKLMSSPEMGTRIRAAGAEPAWSRPEEFQAQLRSETAFWQQVARQMPHLMQK